MLPLHSHTKQFKEIQDKFSNNEKLSADDVLFLFDTIEQLEGELKEWIALYEENVKR